MSYTQLELTPGNLMFYWLLIPAIKIAVTLAVLPLIIAGATYAERKIIGFIQVRLGPMRVGPWGLLQPIADVLKLLIKEDIVPRGANRFVFVLAPILVVIPAFVVYSVVPFGPELAWAETFPFSLLRPVAEALGADVEANIPLYITDLDIGLLFVLAVSSLGVIGILLAGWSSNSKYPLLGGLRSAAQMISYEVPLGFALIAALMLAGTLSMRGIIEAQQELGLSLWLLQPIGLFLYFVAGVAEVNRVPFDLPEAETELVSGFHTEYSGMKFAFFFLAEYANMITVAAIAATVFLGGWLPPLHGLIRNVEALGFMYDPRLCFLWFALKTAALFLLYYWLRATFPRYRYDQLMRLGWKWLIPLSLFHVLWTGLAVVVVKTAGLGDAWLVLGAALEILIVLIALYLVRGSGSEHEEKAWRPAH